LLEYPGGRREFNLLNVRRPLPTVQEGVRVTKLYATKAAKEEA
jgi:hypothetical protein